MKKTNILLCDDEKLLRISLSELIQKWTWVGKVDVAANGNDALQMMSQKPYDVLLLDINMPQRNGISVAQEILRKKLPTRILVLTNHDGDALIANLYRLGVHGFVLKDTDPVELEHAILSVVNDNRYFTPAVQKVVNTQANNSNQLPDINTAPRHKQVLELLIKGKSSKEIADQLNMSLNTVNSYKSDMMELTQTQSTPELIAFVVKNGIL